MTFRSVLYALVVAAALPATASADQQPPAPPPATREPPILVTAIPLSATAKAVEDCLARHCPPPDDINAALAHAANLFVAGRYKDARGVLLGARDRNLRFSRDYPEDVAGLLRANARIGAHLGETATDRFDSIVAIDILKRAFPASDARVLQARIDLGDQRLRAGDTREALDIYRQVAAAADTPPRMKGLATIRQLLVYGRLDDLSIPYDGAERRRAEAALYASDDPILQRYAQVARVLEARAAARKGDHAALDGALAKLRLGADAVGQPVLIYAPEVKLTQGINAFAMADPWPMLIGGPAWVDIGFWINPDGSVSDIQPLRQSKGEQLWQKQVLRAIAGRRYAPFDADTARFAQYRVERYTLTAAWTTETGSRIRVRAPTPRLEMLDLTLNPAPPPNAGAPG